MTWKSYAAVSGATVLAGWLASTPPASAPAANASANASSQPRKSTAGSDIEREAERLEIRAPRDVQYSEPRRNPFRFGADASDADGAGDIRTAAPVEPTAAIPVVSAPVSLSGIAEDQNGNRIVRTAVLSSPSGVLLVREGDPVLGGYRVGRIESEAVELVSDDGTVLRLTFKP